MGALSKLRRAWALIHGDIPFDTRSYGRPQGDVLAHKASKIRRFRAPGPVLARNLLIFRYTGVVQRGTNVQKRRWRL